MSKEPPEIKGKCACGNEISFKWAQIEILNGEKFSAVTIKHNENKCSVCGISFATYIEGVNLQYKYITIQTSDSGQEKKPEIITPSGRRSRGGLIIPR